MLSDQVTELLTAFVDGELTKSEREAVLRLLNKSPEAREMLRQLQENAHKLKQLPQHKVEPSLVAQIMEVIAERQATPKPAARPRIVRRRWLPYVAASLAASMLIAAISYLYWTHMIDQDGPKDDRSLVQVEQPAPKPDPQPQPQLPTPREPNPLLDKMVQGTFGEFGKKIPVDVFTATFAELRDNVKTGQLAKELKNAKEMHFDISVKNNKGAMDRLKDVLKDRGITLVADPTAAKTLADKNQAKVEYLVYAENLTPDEVTKLMSELGKSYIVSSGKNQSEVNDQYRNVTVEPVAKEQKQKVFTLLGNPAEPKDLKQPPNLGRQALLLPTLAPKTPSKEVVQFVNKRQPAQPGTIQVLIRIRQE